MSTNEIRPVPEGGDGEFRRKMDEAKRGLPLDQLIKNAAAALEKDGRFAMSPLDQGRNAATVYPATKKTEITELPTRENAAIDGLHPMSRIKRGNSRLFIRVNGRVRIFNEATDNIEDAFEA